MSTHITEPHRHAFEALVSGEYDNFALSCFIDGSPDAAIVSVTPAMTITDHDGAEA